MRRKRSLERRLRELQVPDEDGAEERAWKLVRAAYGERDPASPTHRVRRLAVALAAGAAMLALGLSPAGARVADLVRDFVGAGDAEPVLTQLPAAGEILVESGDGAWIVREDGSKRRLGDYEQATWSPHGLHIAVAGGRQLAAVDPFGEVRWTITAPREIRDPRWSGTYVDTRIAYRRGEELWVVAGDGTRNTLLARDLPPVAPAWYRAPKAKLRPGLRARAHMLAYASASSRIAIVDADSRDVLGRIRIPGREAIKELEFSADGSLLLVRTAGSLLALEPLSGRPAWRSSASTSAAALSPDGGRVAAITEPDERSSESRLLLIDARTGEERRLPAGLGQFRDLAWSPDGRWLLLAWRAADQWLFIRPDRPRRVVAVGDISRQFAPGPSAAAEFPSIAGWVLPDRP